MLFSPNEERARVKKTPFGKPTCFITLVRVHALRRPFVLWRRVTFVDFCMSHPSEERNCMGWKGLDWNISGLW